MLQARVTGKANFTANLTAIKFDALKPLDTSPIWSNAWLAGMWDADGGFQITISYSTDMAINYAVIIRAKIELRTNYHRLVDPSIGSISYFGILEKIATYFKVRVNHRKRERLGRVYYSYIVSASGKESHEIIRSYFTRFPLFTSKYMNYLSWLEIHKMRLRGEHTTPEGLERCWLIKSNFNTNFSRQSVTWEHLINFYI